MISDIEVIKFQKEINKLLDRQLKAKSLDLKEKKMISGLISHYNKLKYVCYIKNSDDDDHFSDTDNFADVYNDVDDADDVDVYSDVDVDDADANVYSDVDDANDSDNINQDNNDFLTMMKNTHMKNDSDNDDFLSKIQNRNFDDNDSDMFSRDKNDGTIFTPNNNRTTYFPQKKVIRVDNNLDLAIKYTNPIANNKKITINPNIADTDLNLNCRGIDNYNELI